MALKKNILLLGGSHGIGLEVAKQLQKKHTVFVASRTKGELNENEVTHIPFDVTTDNLDSATLPDQLHGFVYCPGSINLRPFKIMNMETFHEDMQLNFFSLVNVVKTIMPKMAKNSSLVFFSTVAVGTGMPFHTSIAAAKGAVEGFAKALAAEYAPKLRVNVIAPSLTATALAKRLLNNENKKELMARRHPLKRIGEARDIASAATFLLSRDSEWITGQVIRVDGGISTLNIN